MYKLTDEGERYLKEGLPEKNLLELLTKPSEIREIKNKVGNFDIALLWAKRKGWIKIDSGKLIPLKKPKNIPEQEALKNIAENKEPDTKILDILIRRNLAEEVRENILKIAEKQIKQKTNVLTPELIKTGMWKNLELKPYNVKAPGKKLYLGKLHPYNQFLSEVRQKLVELGFKEMTGPLIELEFWNFDALYQAQNHPSRDWTQTYSLKHPVYGILPKTLIGRVKSTHETGWKTGSTGWGYTWNRKKASKLMPRAHDTAISPRYLSSPEIEIPGKYFSLVRCFRPDVIDVTHAVEFNQLGGFIVDKNLTIKKLFGLLKTFALEFAGVKTIKFLPDYYPFTEASVQLSAKHPKLGWMELAGAGIFRPEVTLPLGISEPVIAWGFGIDRLAMLKLGINDIRELFSRDLQWLRDKPM